MPKIALFLFPPPPPPTRLVSKYAKEEEGRGTVDLFVLTHFLPPHPFRIESARRVRSYLHSPPHSTDSGAAAYLRSSSSVERRNLHKSTWRREEIQPSQEGPVFCFHRDLKVGEFLCSVLPCTKISPLRWSCAFCLCFSPPNSLSSPSNVGGQAGKQALSPSDILGSFSLSPSSPFYGFGRLVRLLLLPKPQPQPFSPSLASVVQLGICLAQREGEERREPYCNNWLMKCSESSFGERAKK